MEKIGNHNTNQKWWSGHINIIQSRLEQTILIGLKSHFSITNMSTLQESITNLTACKYNLKNFIIYEPKTDKTAKRKKMQLQSEIATCIYQ